jgi:uncharacterized delta-60 repeat protein
VFIQPPLEGEAHAIAFQNVNGEQRILVGGWAYDPTSMDGTGPNFALMRLNPDGSLDPTFNGTGISIASFYDNSHVETIDTIAIQQGFSTVCGDTTTATDKIVVAGKAYPHEQILPPSDQVIALMRFCADGRLDTSWGGRLADWWYPPEQPHYDPAGGVTVNVAQGSGCHDWMRTGEALALAIEPGTNKIVVGGHGLLPSGLPQGGTSSYFVVARLNADGTYDSSFGGEPCNPGGRVYFKGGADHVDDSVNALALIPDADDPGQWDILVAGPDKQYEAPYHQIAVALVDDTGAVDAGFGTSGVQLVDYGQDAVASGMAVEPADGQILVGGTTCPSGCTGLTPQSDFALAGLSASGAVDYQLQFDVDYTDIANSVVLQPQTPRAPKVLIGGYSASAGGIPYMSGVRVNEDGTGTPEPFRSNFHKSVSPGDQAGQLLVQDDNKILAGGYHTKSNGPGFGIIRLCSEPDQASCSEDMAQVSPPPGVVQVDAAVLEKGAWSTTPSAPILPIPDSPAPPVPEAVVAPADIAPRGIPEAGVGESPFGPPALRRTPSVPAIRELSGLRSGDTFTED